MTEEPDIYNLKLCLRCSRYYFGEAQPSAIDRHMLSCPHCQKTDLYFEEVSISSVGFKKQKHSNRCPGCNAMVYNSVLHESFVEYVKLFNFNQDNKLIFEFAAGFKCHKCGTLMYASPRFRTRFSHFIREKAMINVALERLAEKCPRHEVGLIPLKVQNIAYTKTNGELYMKDLHYKIHTWCIYCRQEYIFSSKRNLFHSKAHSEN